jgi:DNA-3-methyladenine glycosylase
MRGEILRRPFYMRDTVTVARDLLGMTLVHGPRSGRIVEVEAYIRDGDQAAHFWRGRTPRTSVIYGPPGHAYIYFVYGMHDCFNVVTEPEGVPGAVLIRGVEGQGDGPGKLTRAMGITRALNGADLTSGPLTIRRPKDIQPFRVEVTPRIGITRSVDLPLRFILRNS